MLKWISQKLVRHSEKRIGVELNYAHKIATTSTGLMIRYGKIFSFLDPNKKVPADAYHIARLRGAISADCGTCVEAEINLAKSSGIQTSILNAVLKSDYDALTHPLSAVAELSDAVTGGRRDAPDARDVIVSAYGEAGLIELCFAMNGAVLLPGIKRGMGYATTCDLTTLRKLA